jgi:hypothetical protein
MIALGSLGLLAACEDRTTTTPAPTNTSTPTNPPSSSVPPPPAPQTLPAPRREPAPVTPPPAPDNTGRNDRDRDGGTLTPEDQSESAADRKITADIRTAITSDSSMSMNARNVKIITLNGVVTLRGPVETQGEKDAIEAKAESVAGVTRVDNQLEVKPGNQ